MKVGEEYLMIKSLVNMHDVASGKCYIGKFWSFGDEDGVDVIDDIGDFFALKINEYTVIGRLKVTKTP